MNKLEKQKEIFKKFMHTNLLPCSNKYWITKLDRKNIHYYFIYWQDIKIYSKDPTIYIIRPINDFKPRFLKKWKVWETNKWQVIEGWVDRYLIGLDPSNKYDKEIIDVWDDIALGCEDIMLVDDEIESVKIAKW